jgi:hypothetical protein
VLQPGRRLRLGTEPLQFLRGGKRTGQEHLQCDDAAEIGLSRLWTTPMPPRRPHRGVRSCRIRTPEWGQTPLPSAIVSWSGTGTTGAGGGVGWAVVGRWMGTSDMVLGTQMAIGSRISWIRCQRSLPSMP